MKSGLVLQTRTAMKRDYEDRDDSSSESDSDDEWERPSSCPKMTMYADVEEQRQRIHAERDFRNRLNRTPWEHMLNDYTPPMPSAERWKHDKWEEILDEPRKPLLETYRSRSPVSIRYPPSMYSGYPSHEISYRPVYDKESYYRTREKFLPPISIPGCPPGLPSSSGKPDLLRSSSSGCTEPNRSQTENDSRDKAASLPEFQKDKGRLGSVVISVDAKESAAGREVRLLKKDEGKSEESEETEAATRQRHERDSLEEDGESGQKDGECPPGMRGSTWSYSTLPKLKRQSTKQKNTAMKEEGEISSESEEEILEIYSTSKQLQT